MLAQIEASSCRLLNPLEPVRWNSDKSYLFDLNRWGVPIVPTLPAPLPAPLPVSIADAASMQAHIVRNGWERVVVKPSIGAGAADVHLVSVGEIGEILARVSVQRSGQAFLVQPLIESVLSEPILYFALAPAGVGRLVSATLRRVGRLRDDQ